MLVSRAACSLLQLSVYITQYRKTATKIRTLCAKFNLRVHSIHTKQCNASNLFTYYNYVVQFLVFEGCRAGGPNQQWSMHYSSFKN